MGRHSSDDPLVPFPVRLKKSVVAQLKAEAAEKGRTNSDVFRHYLGLKDAQPLNQPRPRPMPKYEGKLNNADPKLMRALAGIGNNLNQIAFGVSTSNLANEPLDRVRILAALHKIEQHLQQIGAANAA